MFPDKDVMCHHTGFTVSCIDGVTKHKCQKWIHIAGKKPQSEEIIDQYGCADKFTHLLMIENSQMQRQTAREINVLRNVVLQQRDQLPGEPLPMLEGNARGRPRP
jgi:hypothetical protein